MKKENTWISWNENVKHSFTDSYDITTEEEFADAIKNAENVRFYGSKQSSSDIAAGTDSLINIKNYNQIIAIDKASKKITVQSGIELKDLLEKIESLDWCIPCLPDINTITLGGALATGTHGTNGGLISSYMTSCRLIKADGTIQVIDEKDVLMDAVRVSLGVLGAFSTITLQCEESYTLHLIEEPESDAIWTKNLDNYLSNHDFLRILWLPHTGMGYVIKGKKIPKDQHVDVDLGPAYLKNRRKASKFLYQLTKTAPWTIYFANKILYHRFFKSRKEHKGNLYQATVTKSRGSTLELAEWTVDFDKFPSLLKELSETINSFKNKSFIHIPMDVRFVDSDESWLSNAYKRKTVTMGCVSRDASSADSYEAFKTVEDIFLKYGGRPHWGKRFAAKDLELAELYPKWDNFKDLRKSMDPTNKFLNKYLASVFSEKI